MSSSIMRMLVAGIERNTELLCMLTDVNISYCRVTTILCGKLNLSSALNGTDVGRSARWEYHRITDDFTSRGWRRRRRQSNLEIATPTTGGGCRVDWYQKWFKMCGTDGRYDVIQTFSQGCSGGGARGSDAPVYISQGSGAPLNAPKTHNLHVSMPECVKAHLEQARILRFFSGVGPPDPSLSEQGEGRRKRGNRGRGKGRVRVVETWGKGTGKRRPPKQIFTTTPLNSPGGLKMLRTFVGRLIVMSVTVQPYLSTWHHYKSDHVGLQSTLSVFSDRLPVRTPGYKNRGPLSSLARRGKKRRNQCLIVCVSNIHCVPKKVTPK